MGSRTSSTFNKHLIPNLSDTYNGFGFRCMFLIYKTTNLYLYDFNSFKILVILVIGTLSLFVILEHFTDETFPGVSKRVYEHTYTYIHTESYGSK